MNWRLTLPSGFRICYKCVSAGFLALIFMAEPVTRIQHHPVAVQTPGEYKRFCALPAFPPVRRAALDRQRPDALWMLTGAGDSVTARCALWWERTPSHAGHRLGLIGHCAAGDASAAARLLELACAQLAAHGCTLAVGPMDGSTWQNYRLIVERGSEPTFFMEPDHAADWPRYFLNSGFTVLARYYSALTTGVSEPDPGMNDVVRHVESQGIGVRALSMANLSEELSRIHELTIECFRDAFLFTPISREDFLAQFLELRACVRPELILLAEQSQRLIGFIFAVPDSGQAAREAARNALAWEDIDDDEDTKKRIDEGQKNLLARNLKNAQRDLDEALFRSYRHVYLLGKDNKLRPIDLGQITSSAAGSIVELILRELQRCEEITDGMSPARLIKYWPQPWPNGPRRRCATRSTRRRNSPDC